MSETPTRSDFLHVKALALIAIMATQIPIWVRLCDRVGSYTIREGQKLFTVDGNPIDGFSTNYVEVSKVADGWVKITEQNGMVLTLRSDVVQACYKPVK